MRLIWFHGFAQGSGDMNIRFEVAKIMLELDRLNVLRSFTRQPGETKEKPLSWQALRYVQLRSTSEVGGLLNAITVYGALACGAGEALQLFEQSDEWLFTFNRIGERLFFTLPQYLNEWKQASFEKDCAAAFRLGWRGDSLPSPV